MYFLLGHKFKLTHAWVTTIMGWVPRESNRPFFGYKVDGSMRLSHECMGTPLFFGKEYVEGSM